MESLPLPTLISFAALLGSAIFLWMPLRFAWAILFVIALIAGYAAGVLSGPAVVPIALLAAACRFYGASKAKQIFPGARVVLGIVIVVVALLLGFHVFPGFHNPLYVKNLVLSPDAGPYTKALTFDTWAAGILIMGLCCQDLIRSRAELFVALRRAWPVVVVNVAVLVPLALVLGFVRFDPKWTSFFWTWAVLQLFFTILTEEAFFRGFIQRELAAALAQWRFGRWTALGTAALLFGVSHFGGGFSYVLLATLAGVGYGLAFQRSGRIEMSMLAHFAVNSTRFLFFTYPYVV